MVKFTKFDFYTKEEYLALAEEYSELASKAFEVYQETGYSYDLANADHFWDTAEYYKKKAEAKE